MEATKVERIESIIKSALAEFVEKGFENTTMNSIADRANLSKGGLYHHFSSKEELLFVVNNEIMRPIVNLMKETEKINSAIMGLRYYIKEFIKYWVTNKKELEITLLAMSRLTNSDENKLEYFNYMQNMKNFLEILLKKGVEQGELKKNNYLLNASIIFTLLDGNIVRIAYDKDVKIEQIFEEVDKIIIEPLIFKLSW
ncbi:MAG: TetR/AcrR family transcriptional regulator [bacterium]